MGEVFLVAALALIFGGSSKPKSNGSGNGSSSTLRPPAEDACSIRVDVDGKVLAICRVGARWRMYVDHQLDPRTFADLPGVLQRAVVVSAPAIARRITFETDHGTATVLKLDDGTFEWSFTPADDPQATKRGAPEPTMLDALGSLYGAIGREFFA